MRFAAIALLIFGVCSLAHATDSDSWLGEKVFWKQDAKARLPDKEIEIHKVPFPATVSAVEGDWLWLGSAWVKKSDVHRTSDALDHYTAKLTEKPKDKAKDKKSEKKDDKAKKEESKDKGPDKKIAGIYRARASVWLAKGELQNAISDLNDAIKIDPKDAYALSNRGGMLAANHDYDGALRDYSEAIRLNPKFAAAWANRGTVHADKKDYERAIRDYDEAIRIDPNYVNAYTNRGHAYAHLGEQLKAVGDYTKAIRLDANFAPAYVGRGWILEQMGNPNGAIVNYTKAIEINPNLAWARTSRGLQYHKLGDDDRAIQDCNDAIALDNHAPHLKRDLAWVLATAADSSKRNGKQAVELATKAADSAKQKDHHYYDVLAAAHAETGNFDEARRHALKAIELISKPDDKQEVSARLELYKQGKAYHELAGK